MNINYKQPQFELFPANSATLEDINKPRILLANLTLSLESLVIFTILGIMVALFSYSLGVEKGKRLAAQTLDERVSAAWNVAARTAPSVAAALVAPTASITAVLTAPAGRTAVIYKPAPVYKTTAVLKAPAVLKTALPKAIPGNRYTLQGASYGNEEYARQDALALKAKGFQTFLIKSGKYWLLCIGNFETKSTALAFARKLPGDYRSSQVRRF